MDQGMSWHSESSISALRGRVGCHEVQLLISYPGPKPNRVAAVCMDSTAEKRFLDCELCDGWRRCRVIG